MSQALQSIKVSELTIELNKSPKPTTPNEKLTFGSTFTDHMLTIPWSKEKGWGIPSIKPYGNLSLDPAAIVFHYALECFEGLKAYIDSDGEIRMFRPELNMERLRLSCERLTLPTFNEIEVLECIKQLLKLEKKWIPKEKGYSLYIRPTVIGTQSYLGVASPTEALLYVICSPVGPYYPTGFKAVSLYATKEYVRAWPGGTGNSKLGGNYAPGLLAQKLAAENSCQQNLWLFGDEDKVTEVGTMNLFVLLEDSKGELELVTPPLDGTILPGITRVSILDLTRQWGEFKVVEREITMKEIVEASESNRLVEMFGSGTACVVSPIKEIKYNGKTITIPLDPSLPESQAGPVAAKLFDAIISIQRGETESPWSIVV